MSLGKPEVDKSVGRSGDRWRLIVPERVRSEEAYARRIEKQTATPHIRENPES